MSWGLVSKWEKSGAGDWPMDWFCSDVDTVPACCGEETAERQSKAVD